MAPGERVGCDSLPLILSMAMKPSLFHISHRGGALEVTESLNSHTHTYTFLTHFLSSIPFLISLFISLSFLIYFGGRA